VSRNRKSRVRGNKEKTPRKERWSARVFLTPREPKGL